MDLPKHIKEHAALNVDVLLSPISQPSAGVWRFGDSTTYIEVDTVNNTVKIVCDSKKEAEFP